jgi:hypothetical protein
MSSNFCSSTHHKPLLNKKQTSGATKEELIKAILGALGLPGPTRLPLRLWRACMLERCITVGDVMFLEVLPVVLERLAESTIILGHMFVDGQEPARYRAPEGAPPLTASLTLAEARTALLARGVRTFEDLAALQVATRDSDSDFDEHEVGWRARVFVPNNA